MTSFYNLMGVPSAGFDPEYRFVTSWILPPKPLASIRAMLSVYCFITILADWVINTANGLQIIPWRLQRFEDYSFWGIAFYLLAAAIHGFAYEKHGQTRLHRWPKSLQALHNLLYTTIVVYPFLITALFWGFVVKRHWPSAHWIWNDISKYALNSAIAIFEIIIPATVQPPLLHMAFLGLIMGLYVGIVYIIWGARRTRPYDFFDARGGRQTAQVVGALFGIYTLTLVAFLVVWASIWLRLRLTGGKVVRSVTDVGERIDSDDDDEASPNQEARTTD